MQHKYTNAEIGRLGGEGEGRLMPSEKLKGLAAIVLLKDVIA